MSQSRASDQYEFPVSPDTPDWTPFFPGSEPAWLEDRRGRPMYLLSYLDQTEKARVIREWADRTWHDDYDSDGSTEPEDADDENEPDDDQATLPAQTPATPAPLTSDDLADVATEEGVWLRPARRLVISSASWSIIRRDQIQAPPPRATQSLPNVETSDLAPVLADLRVDSASSRPRPPPLAPTPTVISESLQPSPTLEGADNAESSLFGDHSRQRRVQEVADRRRKRDHALRERRRREGHSNSE